MNFLEVIFFGARLETHAKSVSWDAPEHSKKVKWVFQLIVG